MSYQVLARKYRPRRFQELVGQDVVARALTHALEQNRLHHAYLFTGTRGVGKTTIARILSRCLNCETGVSANPCGVCSTCREIDEGRFVDLIEVDAASRTKVEDTRELLENVQYAPTRGRYKVYLIDEVHMLSGHSFNALLKTLEEPPPHVKFLLATTDPQKLPVTILSRCLQFALKPMTPERVVGHLQQVLAQEHIPAEEGALWLLARGAQGSMRDALSLTDQAIAFGHGSLRETEVRALLGSIDRDLVYRVLEAIHGGDAAHLLQVIAGMAEQSIDFAGALAEMISVLHRLAVAQVVPGAIDNAEGDRERLLDLARRITAEDLQLYYQMALHGRRDLPLAVDARAGFEMTVLRMLTFRPQGAPMVSGGGTSAGTAASGGALPGGASSGRAASPAATAMAQATAPVTPMMPTARPVREAEPIPAPPSAVVEPLRQPAPVAAPRAESAPWDMPAAAPATPVAAMSPATAAPVVETAPAEVRVVDPPVATAPPAALRADDPWTPARWADWVDQSGLAGAALNLARHVNLASRRDGRWELHLSPRHQMLAGGQALPQLQERLARAFPGQAISLELIEPDAETPVQRRQRLQQERQQQAEQAFLQDPVVRALGTTFDAVLVPESLSLPQSIR